MMSNHWAVLVTILLTICSPLNVNADDSSQFDEEIESVEMNKMEPGLKCFVDGRCIDSPHVDGSLVSFDKSVKGYTY